MGLLASRASLAGAALLASLACAPEHTGPVALWSSDAASEDNPVPDERAVSDGKLALRDDFAFTFLPKAAWTAAAQTTFDAWESYLKDTGGWGVFAPVLLRFSAPLDPKHLDAAKLAFIVSAPASQASPASPTGDVVIPARAQWVSDPGYLAVRPASPLPSSARVLLAVRRDVDGGDLARSADYDAFCAGAGREDAARAAAALGVDVDDLALVLAYRTGDPTADFARALALVRDRIPSFSFAPPVAPRDLPEELRGQIARLPEGARVAVGTFTDVDFRRDPKNGHWDLDADPTDVTLDVLYTMPDAAQFPPPWPAVIAQHGFDDDRTFGLKVADAFLARGIAVFSIDASSHGKRGSAFALFNVTDPRAAREHLRQTALDDAQLATLITEGHIDVDGVAGDDLDGTVSYFGHSMGTIVAGPLLGDDHRYSAAVLNAPGSSFQDLFGGGMLKVAVGLLLRPALGLGVDDPAYDDALPLAAAVLQTLMEPADPIAYAALRPPTDPPLLLQMNDGDRTLPNEATRDLAAACGVDACDGPRDGASPVDALWVMHGADFGYPADDNPHGLHMFAGAPGIHAQMAEFIRSSGTRLTDPIQH